MAQRRTLSEILHTEGSPKNDNKMAKAIGMIREHFNLDMRQAYDLCKALKSEVGFKGENPVKAQDGYSSSTASKTAHGLRNIDQ